MSNTTDVEFDFSKATPVRTADELRVIGLRQQEIIRQLTDENRELRERLKNLLNDLCFYGCNQMNCNCGDVCTIKECEKLLAKQGDK